MALGHPEIRAGGAGKVENAMFQKTLLVASATPTGQRTVVFNGTTHKST